MNLMRATRLKRGSLSTPLETRVLMDLVIEEVEIDWYTS